MRANLFAYLQGTSVGCRYDDWAGMLTGHFYSLVTTDHLRLVSAGKTLYSLCCSFSLSSYQTRWLVHVPKGRTSGQKRVTGWCILAACYIYICVQTNSVWPNRARSAHVRPRGRFAATSAEQFWRGPPE